MLDARVGEQALEVALAEEVERGQGEGSEPEDEQHGAGEGCPGAALGHLEVAQDRVEAQREQGGRQQGGHGRRCLGVGIGEPGVHRDEAHLRAVAEHREHVGEPDRARVEPVGGRAEELRVREVVGRPEHPRPGVVEDRRREQRQAEPERGQQDVLPGCLGGSVGVLDRDEQHGDHGRHLDGDPAEREPVDDRGEGHRPAEEVGPRVEAPAVAPPRARAAVVEVAGGERRRRGIEEGRRHEEHDRQRVGPEQ